MKTNLRKPFLLIGALGLIILGGGLLGYGFTHHPAQSSHPHVVVHSAKQATKRSTPTASSTKKQRVAFPAPKDMRQPVDWQQSSETKGYPDLNHVQNLSLLVNIRKKRVYVMSGNHPVYTMYAAAGTLSSNPNNEEPTSKTPTGNFTTGDKQEPLVNGQLGYHFNIAFTSHNGTTLYFRTGPTNLSGDYNAKKNKDIGKKNVTDGSIWLTKADAQWLYQNLPDRTKVTIALG